MSQIKIELGDEVKCKITGFKGIVNATSQWLTGCDRVSVQAKLQKDGKFGESYWLDVAAVTVLKKHKVKPAQVQEKKVGGPATKIT